MTRDQRLRVQPLAIVRRFARLAPADVFFVFGVAAPVQGIADERMAGVFEVNPDLVRAARVRRRADQSAGREAFEHLEVGARGAGAR